MKSSVVPDGTPADAISCLAAARSCAGSGMVESQPGRPGGTGEFADVPNPLLKVLNAE